MINTITPRKTRHQAHLSIQGRNKIRRVCFKARVPLTSSEIALYGSRIYLVLRSEKNIRREERTSRLCRTSGAQNFCFWPFPMRNLREIHALPPFLISIERCVRDIEQWRELFGRPSRVPQSPTQTCQGISTLSEKLRTMTHPLGVSELGERKDRTCVRFSEKWGTSLTRQWIQNYQLPDIQIGTPALELRVLLNFMEGDGVA